MNEIKEFARLRTADRVLDPATSDRIWAKIDSTTPLHLVGTDTHQTETASTTPITFDEISSRQDSYSKRRYAVLGTAAAVVLGLVGLVIFQPATGTAPSVATQPEAASLPAVTDLPTTTLPEGNGPTSTSVPDETVDRVLPPQLSLNVDGWEVAAGDLDDRFVNYQFEHLDGRLLDVTIESGGADVYNDRIATLSPDSVQVIDDISQVADLATIGGFRLDALLEPGSDWVLQATGTGFADRNDFVATIAEFEQSPRDSE